mgnify:CR=1 FL=1
MTSKQSAATKVFAPNDARILQLAHETLDIEAQALLQIKNRLTPSFVKAVHMLLKTTGHVVVMGMGKSGHIGRKIAATLASTGTPAMFVHPGEASHGDLGMVRDRDVVLAISNSGESDELAAILPVLKRQGVPLIAMTGGLQSTLANHADVVIDCGVDKEACPLNLAPTASTTVTLALGDALAVAMLDARGFREEDFARSHPGGSLGRKLLTHVRDVMRTGSLIPSVKPDVMLPEALLEVTRKGMAMTAIVNDDDHVLGIFTDGDLRRLIEQGRDFSKTLIRDVMHTKPRLLGPEQLAVDAVELMEQHRINQVLVCEPNGKLVGALHIHDLTRAKVI